MKKTVAAISRRENDYQAVMIGRRGDYYELQRCVRKSGPANWKGVATEAFGINGDVSTGGFDLIVGYESNRVAFYPLQLPAVGGEEWRSMVRMQAEALLPLPIEEMGVAWRKGADRNGKVAVTIAAARKGQLESFAREVQPCRPVKIMLESEGVVEAWRVLCGGSDERAVVLYSAPTKTLICLAEMGRLALSVTSDVGWDDLAGEEGLRERQVERLIQDIGGFLLRVDDPDARNIKIGILSCGGELGKELAGYFQKAGLTSEPVLIRPERLKTAAALSPAEIYTYLPSIGLALLGLEGRAGTLDLFDGLCRPEEEAKKKRRLPAPAVSATWAIIMLAVFCIVSKGLDQRRHENLVTYNEAVESRVDVQSLEKSNRIKAAIADQRVDVLELLKTINGCVPQGELIDGVVFKKRQPISISGTTKNKAKIYELMENLQKHDDIKTVRLQNPRMDSKDKGITYTITFDYKDYTTK